MSEIDLNKTAADGAAAEKSSEAAAPSGGNKKKTVAIVAAIVALIVIGIGTWMFLSPGGMMSSPAKKVGCIDASAIYALDEFKNAEKQIADFAEKKNKEFEKAVSEKNGKEGAETELQLLYSLSLIHI